MVNINVKLTNEELKYLKKFKTDSWKQFLYKGLWLKGCLKRKPKDTFVGWDTRDTKGKDYKRTKPCHDTGFCPYGQLVEEFPLHPEGYTEFSCRLFGHDCPVFYCAEPLCEKSI